MRDGNDSNELLLKNYKLQNMNTLKITGIVLLFCLAANYAGAQDRRVEGTVNDEKGRIAAVSITEKNMPANGTVSDEDGRFSIVLKGTSGILVFESVGYLKKEFKVGNNSSLLVVLVRDAKTMEDAVVIGYGRQKKITVTGAASEVSGEIGRAHV